jgi:hypothetical protein
LDKAICTPTLASAADNYLNNFSDSLAVVYILDDDIEEFKKYLLHVSFLLKQQFEDLVALLQVNGIQGSDIKSFPPHLIKDLKSNSHCNLAEVPQNEYTTHFFWPSEDKEHTSLKGADQFYVTCSKISQYIDLLMKTEDIVH